ncbi:MULTISPECIES: TetR/AcrR family transcriptional regulator [unclassified Microbacterium]|uniref:TetR/AcrR family transcriptional regulator n=1 Tax=unclassified Microbacterium TaxID=2609290 RepID=UPI00386B0BD8
MSTSPRRPLRADAQRNYDAIIDVARSTFAERGTGASLDDIASRAGVGPGTLYRHFPTREALVTAVLERPVDTLVDWASGLASGPEEPRHALDLWFLATARHMRTYDGLPDLMTTALAQPESPLHEQCRRFADVTETLVEQAKKAGTIRPDVDADDLGALVGSIAWASARRNDSDESLQRLLALATEGLGAER